MLKRIAFCFLFLATPLFAGDSALWKLSDPRGDDYGNGKLAYPMSADFQRGELDLTALAAYPEEGGTRFEATFARPIHVPQHRTIDAVGTQLDEAAKLGFYNFNLDLYVDTDGVAGSGSTTTLPGRQATIDPSTAWEKVICLTPDPAAARLELRRIVVRDERRREQAEGRKGIIDDDAQRELQGSVDDYVFFPTTVRVAGNRISFFVPASFLEQPKKEWSYVVAVTGADLVDRFDQTNRLMRGKDQSEALMILPVTTGRPLNRFGGAVENDDLMPPIVDLIVGAGQEQKKVLSNYDPDANRPVVLKGVKP